MSLTYSPAITGATTLPSFSLPTVDGRMVSTSSLKDARAFVFVFMCNHCPYVKAIENRLLQLAQYCRLNQIYFAGICSNDPLEYPEDSPKELLKTWTEKKYAFDYLLDEDQTVAKLFGAVCTPDFFVYNQEQELVYRGRLDDSWRDEKKVKNEELKEALKLVLSGKKPNSNEQKPSMGCSIKWKK